ncbi:MAG: hypothetical protein NT162_00830 [Candidatus Woesebacteria bacterium]|nr:hypothetical protein [Candidatus Woesebacteria bacterium]
MINQNWIYFGLAVQSWGGLTYLIDTIKGRVQPNKVSWLLWSIAPLIAFFAMIKQGVGLEAWATFIVGFIPLVVFLASFVNKKAKWEIGKLDIVCGVLSVLGLILWLVTKVGNIAILFSIMADGLAAVPTIVKSYKEPESEDYFVYAMGIINAGIALLIITSWNFQNWGFPLYLLFVNLILAVLIRFKLGKTLSKSLK